MVETQSTAKYRSPEVLRWLGDLGERGVIDGQGGVDFGEDLVEGGGRPAEGVGELIPFGDELVDGVLEGGQIGEVGRPKTLASEGPKPLLHGVHPGTVDRREMGDEPRVSSEPRADELAVMDRDVVGQQVDCGHRGGEGLIEELQEGEILDLALASGGDP